MGSLQFFPDISEVESARRNVFDGTPYILDYLSKPTGLEDFGFGKKEKIADHVQRADAVFVAAYPYFNVNGKLFNLHVLLLPFLKPYCYTIEFLVG